MGIPKVQVAVRLPVLPFATMSAFKLLLASAAQLVLLSSAQTLGQQADENGCTSFSYGDGWCDMHNNKEICQYDHGDCCMDTCQKGRYMCGRPAIAECGEKGMTMSEKRNCLCKEESKAWLENFWANGAVPDDMSSLCLVTGVVERFDDCKYDVNFDGNINVFDNMMIIDVILGKTEALTESACHTLLPDFKPVDCCYDVNGDSNVDIGDVTKIFSVVSKA